MTGEPDHRLGHLRPLWALATTTVVAIACTLVLPVVPEVATLGFNVAGLVILVGSAATRHRTLGWAVAGVLLGLGRGSDTARDRVALTRLIEQEAAVVRFEAVVVDGWQPARWGWRAAADVRSARNPHLATPLGGAATIEVRTAAPSPQLPPPGSHVAATAAVRGQPERPRLVVSSTALLETTSPPAGLHAVRQLVAEKLLAAAGTSLRRIRTAELAAALTVGRRDLMPRGRIEGWRRSGLAHLLAVSGLHVGLVGGSVWLAALACGARLRTARWLVMVALVGYTAMAGAPPSAVRAATMGLLYLAARSLGRPLEPLAAVLVAGVGMLLLEPALISAAGFHLTVLLTAALVRWVPPLVKSLPLPGWLAATLAVPVVAQLAALPLVMVHFHTVVPGSLVANLLVPPLLAPMLLTSLAAAATAALVPELAAALLEVAAAAESLLWLAGTWGRRSVMVAAAPPEWLIAILAVSGWSALLPGRQGRRGAVAWLATAVAMGLVVLSPRAPARPAVVLLPVADGLAALVEAPGTSVLVDAGRLDTEAVELLAERGRRRLEVVVATHSDDDHIGGMIGVVQTLSVGRLVIPAWLAADRAAAPMLAAASDAQVAVVAVARGSVVTAGDLRLEVLWPPAGLRSGSENERSLVLRVRQPAGVALVTADTGAPTERTLVRRSSLGCDVLVVPHHGSRGSSSAAFLERVGRPVGLIPAGRWTTHPHPHPETLARLERRGIDTRWPGRDGWCEAHVVGDAWRLAP